MAHHDPSTGVTSRLTPQMADYDRMSLVWLPHIMYLQEPNYRSESVNTDAHGMRITIAADGAPITLESVRNAPCNLLIGNSTAFGVAARSDRGTIASALSHRTGEPWLNLSGRSFSSTQELLLFQTYFSDLKKVRRIVLFSGANNIILHLRSHRYPARYGSFFFWHLYQRSMTDASLSPNRRRLKTLLSPLYGDRIDYATIDLGRLPLAMLGRSSRVCGTSPRWPGADKETNREEVADWLRRDLRLWRVLADAIGAQVVYVLQPLGKWVNKTHTLEETALFAEMSRSPRKFHRVLSYDLDGAVYDWIASRLTTDCRELDIPFIDMNAAFTASPIEKQWIFNDFIHLTDEGYELAADIIATSLDGGGSAL